MCWQLFNSVSMWYNAVARQSHSRNWKKEDAIMTIHHAKQHSTAAMRRALAQVETIQANRYKVVTETAQLLQETAPRYNFPLYIDNKNYHDNRNYRDSSRRASFKEWSLAQLSTTLLYQSLLQLFQSSSHSVSLLEKLKSMQTSLFYPWQSIVTDDKNRSQK